MLTKGGTGLDTSNILNLLTNLNSNGNGGQNILNNNVSQSLLSSLLNFNKNNKTQTLSTQKGEIEKFKKIKQLD